MRRIGLLLFVGVLVLIGCDNSQERATNAVNQMTALQQMEIAFEGGYTIQQIKPLLDKAMQLYRVPITEENYNRIGNALVALRKNSGMKEMDILNNMIRSYNPRLTMSFGEAAEQALASVKHFNFTVEQYIQRYNESLSTLEQSMRMRKKGETANENSVVIQASVNKNPAMLIQAKKDNRLVDSLTFVGGGDGSLTSGINLIVCLVSVIMAVENPQMSQDERGEIVRDLGFTDNQFPNEGEELKFIRNGVKYNLSKLKKLGIWLTAEPI